MSTKIINSTDEEIMLKFQQLEKWPIQSVVFQDKPIEIKRKWGKITCKLVRPFSFNLRFYAICIIFILILCAIFPEFALFYVLFSSVFAYYALPFIADKIYEKKYILIINEFKMKYLKN